MRSAKSDPNPQTPDTSRSKKRLLKPLTLVPPHSGAGGHAPYIGITWGEAAAEANRKCWFEGSVKDEHMKFGVVVQWVRTPPGQSLASRSVASLAVGPVTGRLMRRWASK
jgi:hypothetical protein